MMSFAAALLLASINFSSGAQAIVESNRQVVLPDRTVQSQQYVVNDEDIVESISGKNKNNSFLNNNAYRSLDEFPDYKDNAVPEFVRDGNKFSMTWEHTVRVIGDSKEEQMKEFYQQLSGYMGCEIDRYKSFGHCFGSGWFGGGHNDRRQVYNGANVMTGLVTEKIENGMLQSISGTYDTTIEQVEFMEPKYTEDEACRTLRNLLIRDLGSENIPDIESFDSLGLWIDRNYESSINKHNKLYYIFEVYMIGVNHDIKWYKLDAQGPKYSEIDDALALDIF
jgi:hypothetical protein